MFDTLSQQINLLSSVLCPDMGSHVSKGRQGDNCSLGRSWDPWRRPLAQPDVPVCSHTKLTLLDRRVGGNWILLFIYLSSYQLSWSTSDCGDGDIKDREIRECECFPKIALCPDFHPASSWLEGVAGSNATEGCIVHIPGSKTGGIFSQDTHSSGTIDCIPRPLPAKNVLTACWRFLHFFGSDWSSRKRKTWRVVKSSLKRNFVLLRGQMIRLHVCIIIFQPALKQMFDDNQCKVLMIYDQELTFLPTTCHPWIEFVNTIFRPSLSYLMLCRQPDADMILSKQLQIVTKPIKHLVSRLLLKHQRSLSFSRVSNVVCWSSLLFQSVIQSKTLEEDIWTVAEFLAAVFFYIPSKYRPRSLQNWWSIFG